MNEDKRYEEARRHVEAIKGFYIHLFIYLLVNAVLIIANLTSSPEYLWFIWPLLGWGFGLLGHAAGVFGLGGFPGRDWEEKKIRRIMEKMGEGEHQQDEWILREYFTVTAC